MGENGCGWAVGMRESVPDLHILPTPEEAAREAAKLVVNLAVERVEARGRFTIALAGGSTPRLLYRTLA